MGVRRFEMTVGGASKFWQVEHRGHEVHLAWGKIGTVGQSKVKSFEDEAKALAAAQKLVSEKTNDGYVETAGADGEQPNPPAAAGPTSGELVYAIADFDAEDTYHFDVRFEEGALVVHRGEVREDVVAQALEQADGIWVLAQGARLPAAVDASRTPPFLVSRRVRDALARGECVLSTGFDEAQALRFTAAPLDALSEEGAEAAARWRGPTLVATGDQGSELVIANAETPQLVFLRSSDVCTVTWMAGALDGARRRAPKPAPAHKTAKKQPAAAIAASADAPRSERLKAIKALGKSASDEAMRTLASLMLDGDDEISRTANGELSRAFYARRNAGHPFDPLPLLSALVASSHEEPVPDPGVVDTSRVPGAINRYLEMVQGDPREEVTGILRSLAWGPPRGAATPFAQQVLASRGDSETLERLSFELLDARLRGTAAAALVALGAVGIERAGKQLNAAEAAERGRVAMALFDRVERMPVGSIDASAWWSLLEAPLETLGPNTRISRWRQTHGLR